MLELAGLGTQHELATSAGVIRYRERGEGRPVVFVHGIVANSALWRNVVPALGPGLRCITPDWPLGSHQLALERKIDMSLPGLARLIEEVLELLDLEDVVLVGNDTGGAIVQCVAARNPSRVGALVLTPCDAFDNFLPLALKHLQLVGRRPPGLWLVGQSLRFRAIHRLPIAFGALTVRPIDLSAMRAYTGPLRTNAGVRSDFARLVRAVSTRHTQSAAERLPRFDKPALVIWSGDDRLFPLRHGRELARLLPQGRFELIDDTGAFIPEDRPQELARLIGEFLTTAVPPPGEHRVRP